MAMQLHGHVSIYAWKIIMPTTLYAESTLTNRYQTTIPKAVRRVLGLKKRDKIHYSIRANGEVVLSRGESNDEEDPVLGIFLAFLAHDIALHLEHLVPLTGDLLTAIREAAKEVDEINIDTQLSGDDE